MRIPQRLRREDGAAAVEFALIVGVLAMLIFGMLQFGLTFFELQNLRASAREGGRLGAVGATPDAIRADLESASNGAIQSGEASDTSFVKVSYSDNREPSREPQVRTEPDREHAARVRLERPRYDRRSGPRADVPRVGALAPPESLHAQHPAPSDDHHEADHRCAVPLRGSEIDHMSPARRRLVLNVREERRNRRYRRARPDRDVRDDGARRRRRRTPLEATGAGQRLRRRRLVRGVDVLPFRLRSTPRTPEAAADPLAAQNVTGLDPTTTPNNATVLPGTCHTTASGGVKVQYSQQQHLFFAPVLGFSNQNGVTTKAYAVWGPAGAANPVPIVVYTSLVPG